MQHGTGKSGSGRKVPVWVFIVAGVLLVGLAGTAALLMSSRGGGAVPEAEVVTLPVPTPTVSPIARAEGTAFYEALPTTVLDFSLSESADAPELVASGALEGYRLGYTDGSATLTLLAGQWESPEAATAAYAAMTAAVEGAGASDGAAADAGTATEPATGTESPSATGTESPSAVAPGTGEVEVDGAVVGAWVLTVRPDGTGTLTWSNSTVVLQLSGPAARLRDVYTAFPL